MLGLRNSVVNKILYFLWCLLSDWVYFEELTVSNMPVSSKHTYKRERSYDGVMLFSSFDPCSLWMPLPLAYLNRYHELSVWWEMITDSALCNCNNLDLRFLNAQHEVT